MIGDDGKTFLIIFFHVSTLTFTSILHTELSVSGKCKFSLANITSITQPLPPSRHWVIIFGFGSHEIMDQTHNKSRVPQDLRGDEKTIKSRDADFDLNCGSRSNARAPKTNYMILGGGNFFLNAKLAGVWQVRVFCALRYWYKDKGDPSSESSSSSPRRLAGWRT